jgi:hypothetical protein
MMLSIGKGASSGRIPNMIMLAKQSPVLICTKSLLMIGKDTMSQFLDALKISLLSDTGV